MYNINDKIENLLGWEGESLGFYVGTTHSMSNTLDLEKISSDKNDNILTEVYKCKSPDLQITVTTENFKSNELSKRVVSVKNLGTDDIVLNKVSSLCVDGIGTKGGNWYDEGRFIIHYAKCTWQGEYQWKTTNLKECSIYPFSTHWNPAEWFISSKGSWNTFKYYPMIMLEDTLNNETFVFEIESPDSWVIAVGNEKSEGTDGSLSVTLNAASMLNDGFEYTLKPGDSYTAVPAVFGKVEGSVNDAVYHLTNYKRSTSLANWKDNTIPVAYNCYMNGIWGSPTEERIVPIIDAAAEMGVELFCIDAGWHTSNNGECHGLGDWKIDDSKYPTLKFKGVIERIINKGMTPGVWLEIEACDLGCDASNLGDDTLLKRNGKLLGEDRLLFNFTSKTVCDHLEKTFDMLYETGVRFIKNDFNQTCGVGFELNDKCYSEAVRENSVAFLNFIDKIKNKYPDMYIENCGSGGLRAGHGVLKHFNIQSTSDQEIYKYYPSIAAGSVMCMPPEKAGIWAMPYPVRFKDAKTFIDDNYVKEHFSEGMKEETVFNMATAFFGAVYMSGRLDKCDSENTKLIKTALKNYKSVRHIIKNASAVNLEDYLAIGERRVYASAIKDYDLNKSILVVWNITEGSAEKSIDIKTLLKGEKVTPLTINDDFTEYSVDNGTLNIEFKNGLTATAFLVD